MNTVAELQELVIQQINEKDYIEDIEESLSGLYDLNPSPTFCASLFYPLIQHAKNNLDMDLQTDIYSKVLSDIYKYVFKRNISKANSFLKQSIFLIKDTIEVLEQEDLIDTDKYGFELEELDFDSMLNFIAIALQACFSIVETLDENAEHNSILRILWHALPKVMNCCGIEPCNATIKIIKATTGICKSIMNSNLLSLYDFKIEQVLNSLLLLLDFDLLSDNIHDEIAQTVTSMIEAYPTTKLIDPYGISATVNSIAASLERKEPTTMKIKCIINASCLLMRNYLKAPWLNDVLLISNTKELEIIKEKAQLLTNYIENIHFSNSQVESMDLDYDNLQQEKRSMDSVLKCESIHKILTAKLESIIHELVCLNQGDTKYLELLSKIREISIYTDNTNISIICKPYIKDIAEFVTKILVLDPGMAESIVQLFDYEIPQFLTTYLQYTLPYSIVYIDNKDTIVGISTSLDLSVKGLCLDNAHHIMLALLMEKNTKTRNAGYERLKSIFNTRSNAHIKLATENATKITTSLSMNLGISHLKDQAIHALEEMKSLLGMPTIPTSDYLSKFIVGILAKITQFISEKRVNSAYIHEPHALSALREIMTVLQPNINDHALHLIKTLQAINELDRMQVEALLLWKKLISIMGNDCIISNLNGIIKGLIQILPSANHNVRVAVSMVIGDVINLKTSTSRSNLDLPILPNFEELKKVKREIEMKNAENSLNIDPDTRLKDMVSNLASPDDVQVSFELQRLAGFLSGNSFSPTDLAPLYSQLLYLVRKYSTHKEIPQLSAVCLGKMGAIDPSLMNVDIIQDDTLLMDTFSSESENREFICGLISNYIFPAYNATSNEKVHQYMQASLQSLLICAGFTEISTMRKTRPLIYRRWSELPSAIKEFLMPFLVSSFESNWRQDNIQYPIFPQAENFSDWIEKWFGQMVSVLRDNAKSILEACIPLIVCKNIDIATYLIPYAVFSIAVNGFGDDVQNIRKEMLSILDLNIEHNELSSEGNMNHQALQVVVSITQYFRKWLNNINPNVRKYDSIADRARHFLKYIPEEKMAIAAFNSGAYPQALMHFETSLKSMPNDESIKPYTLNYLQQIYTQLENRTDLAALLEIYTTVLGYDKEIVRFETSGKWQEAGVAYKDKITRSSSDLSSYTGYLNCLKKGRDYVSIIYFADKFSLEKPQWAASMNSFRIDSAWRVEDWHALDKAVELPLKKTPEAMIGRILARMRRNQNLQSACSIEDVRNILIEDLTSNTTGSYRKVYSTIFNLQLIQELEDAQKTWESPNPVENIQKLICKWEKQDQNIISKYQYKRNLLDLRKAAFFDIRSKDHTGLQASELLMKIAKSCRKAGNLTAALDAMISAEKLSGKVDVVEKAKWYWASGYKKEAFELLLASGGLDGKDLKITLLSARFCALEREAGLKNFLQTQYAKAVNHSEATEKAYHSAASYYYDEVAKKRRTGELDLPSLKKLAYVFKLTLKGLKNGSKFYYTSMPRLINSWFELAKYEQHPIGKPVLEEVNTYLSRSYREIPASQYISFLPRLISHLSINNDSIVVCLTRIVLYVFKSYPRSTLWLMMGAFASNNELIKKRMEAIIGKAKASSNGPVADLYINQMVQLVRNLNDLSRFEANKLELSLKDIPSLSGLTSLHNLEIYIPTERSLYPTLPEVLNKSISKYNPFPDDLPTIKKIGNNVLVMKSLQKPKRISIESNNGVEYRFLVKSQDDLLKDARTMELNYAINSFLKKDPDAKNSELYIRTYAVIPLGFKWGMIQWIDNIAPLKGIVQELNPSLRIQFINNLMNQQNEKPGLEDEKIKFFTDNILPECPAVFYKWFLKNFPEPNQWLNSRTRYIKTLAVMSIVGFMIGLGDRHAENILFDQITGDCIHVDLNMIFDKGALLTVPECVPFRLTHNLVDAMGILGYNGVFAKTCETTMSVMLKNKEALLSIFQTLTNNWDLKEDSFLRDTNARFELRPGSIANAEVRRLIETASSDENLCKMFPGWAPYL